MNRSLLAVLVSVAVLLLAPTANATVSLVAGDVPQADEQNVLFLLPQLANTVNGFLSQDTGSTVQFTSTKVVSVLDGPPRVDGLGINGINSLRISLADPSLGYSCLTINPVSSRPIPLGNRATSATITVFAVSQGGLAESPAVFTVPLDPAGGNNFFTITTTDGEVITSTLIETATGVFEDLRSPRLCPKPVPVPSPPAVVPEPVSLVIWSMFCAGLGLMVWRRRK